MNHHIKAYNNWPTKDWKKKRIWNVFKNFFEKETKIWKIELQMDYYFPNPNLQPSKKDARSKHLESGFDSNILFQYELDADLKRAIISYGNIFF